MLPQLTDTIVAVSSAAGIGGRGIVRLSGPDAFAIAAKLTGERLPRNERRIVKVKFHVPNCAPIPADLYLRPGPRTYTGQALIEIHTFAAAPLLEAVVTECLRHGARAAQPGEFTMRGFLAGKLDLTRVEAVLAVIEAGDQAELRTALAQLAGGVSRPLHVLRDDLLNLLADLEAGLDFADEDIQFISQDDMLARISKALAQLTLVGRQLEERSLGERPFRVVLAGPPNAGKSSLFNALVGHAAALVSEVPGTTRDYLVSRLEIDGAVIELVDTAGLRDPADALEESAQHLGRDQAGQADLILWCCEATGHSDMPVGAARCERIITKCDLALDTPLTPCPPGGEGKGARGASARTGVGIAELRAFLAEHAREHSRPPLAPSLSRCRNHVASCVTHLRRAHTLVLNEDAPELIAVDIRSALEHLGEMVGAVYTNDLLDRIFSRFCIGK